MSPHYSYTHTHTHTPKHPFEFRFGSCCKAHTDTPCGGFLTNKYWFVSIPSKLQPCPCHVDLCRERGRPHQWLEISVYPVCTALNISRPWQWCGRSGYCVLLQFKVQKLTPTSLAQIMIKCVFGSRTGLILFPLSWNTANYWVDFLSVNTFISIWKREEITDLWIYKQQINHVTVIWSDVAIVTKMLLLRASGGWCVSAHGVNGGLWAQFQPQ